MSSYSHKKTITLPRMRKNSKGEDSRGYLRSHRYSGSSFDKKRKKVLFDSEIVVINAPPLSKSGERQDKTSFGSSCDEDCERQSVVYCVEGAKVLKKHGDVVDALIALEEEDVEMVVRNLISSVVIMASGLRVCKCARCISFVRSTTTATVKFMEQKGLLSPRFGEYKSISDVLLTGGGDPIPPGQFLTVAAEDHWRMAFANDDHEEMNRIERIQIIPYTESSIVDQGTPILGRGAVTLSTKGGIQVGETPPEDRGETERKGEEEGISNVLWDWGDPVNA